MSFIKLDRGITEWEWFTDGNMLKMWVYLLTNANYEDGQYKGYPVRRGQVVVGRKKLAERLGMSEQQVRRCLENLKTTNEITIQTTNKFSLITIVKYAFYQGDGNNNNQQANQQQTQQTTNKQPHIKKLRNKEEKNIYNSVPIYDPSTNKIMDVEEENELLALMGRN